MGYDYFQPWVTESIQVRFNCQKCGTEILTHGIGVPSPDLSTEKASDSHKSNWDSCTCQKCNEHYDITVWSGLADAYVDIDSLDDEKILETIEHVPEDDYYESRIESIKFEKDSFTILKKGLEEIRTLNEITIKGEETLNTQKRLLFAATITCLETYLSDRLINRVFAFPEEFERFVKSYLKFQSTKINLSDIYDTLKALETMVKRELLDIVFHNLGKVKKVYESTLQIKFPEISELSQLISIRHDIAHRNGKTKDGESVDVSAVKVKETIEKVLSFCEEIEDQIILI
jgi:hypothetical protein